MKIDYEVLREHYITELAYCSEELRNSYFIGFSKSINESKNYSDSQKVRAMKELVAALNIANA